MYKAAMIFSFSKSIIWLAAPLLLAMPTLATAQSQSSLSGLYGCEAITHKDDQLACFLRETAKLRAVRTAKGYIRFTLANGEVWQQIEPAYYRDCGPTHPALGRDKAA